MGNPRVKYIKIRIVSVKYGGILIFKYFWKRMKMKFSKEVRI